MKPKDPQTRRGLRFAVHQGALRVVNALGSLVARLQSAHDAPVGLLYLESATRWRCCRSKVEVSAPLKEWLEVDEALHNSLQSVLPLWQDEEHQLREDFVAIGEPVSCGGIHALSHHELVISLVRVMLDPESLPGDSTVTATDRRVARLRTARAICANDFDPHVLLIRMERELAKAQTLGERRDLDASNLLHKKPRTACLRATGPSLS